MDNFADLLKLIIPFAIFVVSAILGRSNKKPEKIPVRKENEPKYKYRSAEDVIPNPVMKKKTNPVMTIPEEGERSIFTETPESIESEPEKINFDAREAVIYSTILERKY